MCVCVCISKASIWAFAITNCELLFVYSAKCVLLIKDSKFAFFSRAHKTLRRIEKKSIEEETQIQHFANGKDAVYFIDESKIAFSCSEIVAWLRF